MEVDLGQGHIVLDRDPAPPKEPQQPPILAHVYCGQTAEWINVPLGTEVGLGPGDIVLHRNPAPPKVAQQLPTFRHMSIMVKRSPISAAAELL